MRSCKDNAKFNSVFSATTLSYTTRFWQKRGVIKNFAYLGEFEEDFRRSKFYCVLYLLVIERCKKSVKTDYDNLMHVYLQERVSILGIMANQSTNYLLCFVYKPAYFFLYRLKINHMRDLYMYGMYSMCVYSWDYSHNCKQVYRIFVQMN